MGTQRVRLVGAFIGLALLAAACSSDDDSGGSDAASYLERAGAIEARRAAVFNEVGEVLNSTYTDEARFLEAVAGTDTTDFDAAVAEAREIDPPEQYADEHEAWLDTMRVTEEAFDEIRTLLEEDDLVGVLLAANGTFVDFFTFLIRADADFCRALVAGQAREFGPGQDLEDFCVDPATIPGGEYGLEARRAALRFAAEIGPRIGAPFELGADEDDVARYLEAIQPEVERVFAEILDALRALEPPEELAADHAAAVTYFEDISTIAAQITEAVQQGDRERLQRLFVESGQPGRRLGQALSEDGRILFGTGTILE